MNAAQIKDEIRKLNRIDKIGLYRWIEWIDEESAADLLSRIGVYRSLEIRQEIEQKCRVSTPGRRVHLSPSP